MIFHHTFCWFSFVKIWIIFMVSQIPTKQLVFEKTPQILALTSTASVHLYKKTQQNKSFSRNKRACKFLSAALLWLSNSFTVATAEIHFHIRWNSQYTLHSLIMCVLNIYIYSTRIVENVHKRIYKWVQIVFEKWFSLRAHRSTLVSSPSMKLLKLLAW